MKHSKKVLKYIGVVLDCLTPNGVGIKMGEMEDDEVRVEGKYIGYNLIEIEVKIKEAENGLKGHISTNNG